MNRISIFAAALLLSLSALALDHIPSEYQILTRAEGPAVAAHLGSIDWSQLTFTDDKCNSTVPYAGDTKMTFGTETYRLMAVLRVEGEICPGPFHLADYDSLALFFENVNYGNHIVLSLDKAALPNVEMVLTRGVSVPGKALN